MADNATEVRRNSVAMLFLYPPFLQLKLLEDIPFREALQLDVGESIGVDHGAVSFDRAKFHAATAALYASGGLDTPVTDMKRRKWTLSLQTRDEETALRLARGKTEYHLNPVPMLLPSAADRETALARLARQAGLPAGALAPWRDIVRERTLTLAEIDRLERELARSPIAASRRIAAEAAAKTGSIETMAPPYRDHYAAMAGVAPVDDVAAFRETVLPGIVDDWLRWDAEDGPKMALLTASHGSFADASPLTDLPPDRLVALATWAGEAGDLMAKVAMIELGLGALSRVPALAPLLVTLVEQLRDMDPEAAGARAKLLMAAYIVVEGELARTRLLADFAPFQRRIAALAQASLFERIVFGHLDVEKFARWALDVRGRHFVLQTLIDLRTEPRWAPEGASNDRLDADFVGRIRNAATNHADAIADTPLHDLLVGRGPTSLASRITFPASFLPGPIEGATDPAPDPPPEFLEILDRTLANEDLTAHSVIALINVSSLFRVESERIDRAIELIRAGSYHFSGEVAVAQRDVLLDGLAKVAANTRRPDLANDVRIMLRRLRVDRDSAFPASKEFLTCLTAAAAHGGLAEWARFVGDCAIELALDVDDTDEAGILYSDLTHLCAYEPALRGTAGRAIAALEALLGL